jgi:hypothetical protein
VTGSDRIIASAEAIDKSLAETKGAEFVQRMKESLPKIPQGGGATEERDLKGETDEGLIKICRSLAIHRVANGGPMDLAGLTTLR